MTEREADECLPAGDVLQTDLAVGDEPA